MKPRKPQPRKKVGRKPATPPIVKALTLKQPFAWAVAVSIKEIEYRSWPPPDALIGQRIAIHAGKARPSRALLAEVQASLAENEIVATVPGADEFVYSAIVATATIDGCEGFELDNGGIEYEWYLTDAELVDPPIACSGALGLWNLPNDISTAIT